jgi:NAD-dependent dihydropyrimidine dehydrogenase PreA subunit
VTFVITQPCIDTTDQACVDVCPVDCIHFEEGADRMLYIDPTECIDCGACQPACPVSAIFPEGDVPSDMSHFTEINSLWYQDPEAAREKVGGGGAAPAAAPAAAAAADAPAAEATEAPAAAAAASEASPAPAAPPRRRSAPANTYKYGENGVEGKCALCGTYVIKGGVKFRQKSVLCPDCQERQARIGNPYGATLGRR